MGPTGGRTVAGRGLTWGGRALTVEPQRVEGLAVLERLAAFTPRPRINVLLYHGVLAPTAAWRDAVVPADEDTDPVAEGAGDYRGRRRAAAAGSPPQLARRIHRRRAARMAWCRFIFLERALRSSSVQSSAGKRTERATVVRVFPFPG